MHERLTDLGLTFDPRPPLEDARFPISLAFELTAGGFRVFAALEIVHFDLAKHDKPEDALKVETAAWVGLSRGLSALDRGLDAWFVMATRHQPGSDGSLLRLGWLVPAEGATYSEAARAAERSLATVREIATAFLPFVTVESVSAETVLVDLLRHTALKDVSVARRCPWTSLEFHAPALGFAPRSLREPPPSVVLPFQLPLVPWAPLADAVARCPSPTAFVVRFRTNQQVAPAVVEVAMGDAADLLLRYRTELHGETGGWVVKALEQATHRLEQLRQDAVAFDIALASDSPIGPGLQAIATACLVPSPAGGPDIAWSPTDAGFWRAGPGDGTTDGSQLASLAEIPCLVRIPERPSDESSPLPVSRARFLPLRHCPTVGTTLGSALYRGVQRSVRLDVEARYRHVYAVGQTGTGKSTLLLNMAIADMQAGEGLTVIEPHGTLIADILSRVPAHREKDVIVIDPTNVDRVTPLNPLIIEETDPLRFSATRDRVIDDLLDTFDALYDLERTGGPMFEQYFRTFLTLVMGRRHRPEFTPRLPHLEAAMVDAAFRKELVRELGNSNPVITTTLKMMEEAKGDTGLANLVPYIASKLTRFYGPALARRMLCHDSTLDFPGVVANRKILLVSLNTQALGVEAASLVARQVVLRLSTACMLQGGGPASAPHFLYVDEFHNFATERFAALLSEARKFKLGLVLAHQYTSQLRRGTNERVLDAVLGNVGTHVAFRVGISDAVLLERITLPRANALDISGLSNHTALVSSSGALGLIPFTLRTLPPPPVVDAMTADRVRERSAREDTTSADEVDASLSKALAR